MLEQQNSTAITQTTYLPNNEDTAKIAHILRVNVQEFLERYEADEGRDAVPSQRYCERKLDLYIKGIQRALEAVGQKSGGR